MPFSLFDPYVFYLAVRCIARKFLISPKSDQITRQTK